MIGIDATLTLVVFHCLIIPHPFRYCQLNFPYFMHAALLYLTYAPERCILYRYMRKDTRNIQSICLHCFGTLKRDVCTSCHTRADDYALTLPALQLRTQIGRRYLIAGLLGAGGFGITYLAWDLCESRKVAVKEFFPKEYAVRESGSARVGVNNRESVHPFNHWLNAFVEEAKILIRIKSLHGIVKLLDFIQENNTAYIVTDYLEGESLRNYLSARGNKVPANTALKILRPVFESLCILHDSGVIHKDISPENIIIVLNKYVKLIDFGAAALYKVNGNEKPYVVQKAGYSPVELYRADPRGFGPWTDVYQMGATLYHCVTGYIPAVASEREKEDKLPRPSALGIDLPEYVEDAVMKAMAVKSEDRYQTVSDFAKDLKI